MQTFQRLPQHIGIIPDGNRRWAQSKGMQKEDGYSHGIRPGFELYQQCVGLGVKEITFYGFTQDNTKRPSVQTRAFQKACVDAVLELSQYDANLLVVGNTDSPLFPRELIPYTKRVTLGKGLIKVNFLVNYGWEWDLNHSLENRSFGNRKLSQRIASSEISRIDLIVRWGDRRRLSGFLPVQSIYADFYVLDKMWPDFSPNDLYQALDWYQKQDVTLGG
ncbi:undecaprenyl diphosphate synthase family protein [Faecalispora anaeroviscerum]|uniref:undecaprenyl diphosphate synthase family protein n=1 Tax=Faecalispora anaeroviscerum TaxID=2991836 RepID=UPI0024BAEF41|nr:undecaprenyl diphosphate synthase family protein [Faecalispora anaeroviscerum]